MSNLAGKRVLLIVSGGIAAFKVLELIRLLRGRDCGVTCVLTRSGAEFVTPLSLQALTETKVYGDLFSLTDESEMGHIQLSRSADLVVVAPATANILAKMAAGIGDDLATTLLLATDKPVLVAPAMNVRMWLHAATQANMALLAARGVQVVGPDEGADGLQRIRPRPDGRAARHPRRDRGAAVRHGRHSLAGKHAIVTSGPTHEPIDPVRYIANRSSGRQGHAIAAALAALGARVTLVSGPVDVPDPPGVTVQPHRDRRSRCWPPARRRCRPTSRCSPRRWRTGAWRAPRPARSRRCRARAPPSLELVPNPDILATLSAPGPRRPAPGGRLRRGDRRSDGQRAGQARCARTATGSWPTTSRRRPASWAAPRTRCT